MGRLSPQNRDGIWYLVRRVPKEYAHLDGRRFVKLTTGIRVVDDPRGVRAGRVVMDLNAQLEQDWLDLADGRHPGSERAWKRAKIRAQAFGVRYAPAAELAAGPFEELRRRVQMLERAQAGDDPDTVDALLGTIDAPRLRISGLLKEYEEAEAASLVGKSEEQIEAWRINKVRAVRIAQEVMGDKAVQDLTRDDGIKFRRHFQKRVLDGELKINSANIGMGHFITMLRTVEREKHLGIPMAAFDDLRIGGGERGQRPSFPTDFIRDTILAEGALDGLSPEARRVVYVMIDTGMRPSEIINLLPKHIHLDAKVPHVSIMPEGRRLKTKQSRRDMPLVGVALAAMRLQPQGFPEYLGRGRELSNDVNEYLAAQKLRPTLKHTLYSFRHSFEDRLTTLDPPDKIIGRLMGHKGYREKYGDGPSLEHLQGWLERIALSAPRSL